MILKNDIEVTDPRLGYILQYDERNLDFPITSAIKNVPKIKKRLWNCPWFDQGSTSQCVAYSIGHELAATPVAIKGITNSFLQTLYCEAQKIDPWQGSECGNNPPKYGGTSILAGVKTAQSWGFFKEYRWAYSIDDLALGIAVNGPSVLGVRWYANMTTPSPEGYIKPTGALQGGHAILARGVDYEKKHLILRNSWGKDYGINGDCYISFDDMSELFKQNGEAVFFVNRKYKNIV